MDIIEKVKDKKELRDIDEGFLRRILKKYKEEDFKKIRRDLRIVYGMFKNVKYKRDRKAYDMIFKITGKPKSVLDLGCGYSPMHFPFKSINYYCADIGKNYVKDKGVVFDLLNDDYSKLPKVDIVFLFKVLESLEYFKRNVSKEVISKLKCRYIVVSFDKKSLSGKEIRKKGRSWFRRILNELGLEYEVFDYGDEIFFVIKK
jgi:hypothetical protein